MKKHEITPRHIEEVLSIFATALFSQDFLDEAANSGWEYPFIFKLLLETTPDRVINQFRAGKFDELERVGGIAWKWDVSDGVTGDLEIRFRMNMPHSHKTEEDKLLENEINGRVLCYLAAQG